MVANELDLSARRVLDAILGESYRLIVSVRDFLQAAGFVVTILGSLLGCQRVLGWVDTSDQCTQDAASRNGSLVNGQCVIHTWIGNERWCVEATKGTADQESGTAGIGFFVREADALTGWIGEINLGLVWHEGPLAVSERSAGTDRCHLENASILNSQRPTVAKVPFASGLTRVVRARYLDRNTSQWNREIGEVQIELPEFYIALHVDNRGCDVA